MKKTIFTIIAIFLISAVVYSAATEVAPVYMKTPIANIAGTRTEVASERAADSTRNARLADTLSDHTTELDLKATSAALQLVRVADSTKLQRLADTLSDHTTELDLKATSAALQLVRVADSTKLQRLADTLTDHTTELDLKATSAALQLVRVADSTKLQRLADTLSDHTTELDLKATSAALQLVRVADSTKLQRLADTLSDHTTELDLKVTSAALQLVRVADSTKLQRLADTLSDHTTELDLKATAAAVAALPTTTTMSNIAAQITTVDAIVDTLLAGNVHLFSKTGVAQTASSDDSIAICVVNNGAVEIICIYLEVTTQYTSATDSVHFIIDYPGGYTAWLDAGEEYNAAAVGTRFSVASVTAGTATTKTLVGVPFALPDLKMNLSSGTAITLRDKGTSTDGRAKVIIKYRPLELGARLD